jgi:hypothetical protein
MFGSTAERDAKPSDTQQDRVVFVGGLRRGELGCRWLKDKP